MPLDDWTKRGLSNSARGLAYIHEMEEKELKQKRKEKIREQIIDDFKYEQNKEIKFKEMEQNLMLEKENLEFEKLKEKNAWKRSIITWGISLLATLVSISALIISLSK